MMKSFLNDDFLLDNEPSRRLFGVANREPIFDYHCHLSPKEIYENRQFSDIASLWLEGDHYKWKAMRNYGVDEKYITGDSSNREKFKAWAEVLPYCIGNPLYHWTHLELKRYFGIDLVLSPDTADEIWEKANRKIQSDGFSPRKIIQSSNVAALCTTDDPADTLEYHKLLAEDSSFSTKVLPAFRPDRALNAAAEGFAEWVKKLADVSGITIASFEELKEALSRRIEYFVSLGCVASDHSFASMPFRSTEAAEADVIFRKALSGMALTDCELEKYQTALMTHLSKEYKKNRIAMEIHIGAMRDNNSRMFEKLGPDTGFDSVDDRLIAGPLSRFLDALDSADSLPKTILSTLNPRDNYVLAAMLGNFQSPEVAGKIQFGCAWWVNDHIEGMRRQMTDLANLGVLGNFIGMVTDSRSFLSYPRHEYFRRILSNLLGTMVEHGEYPPDYKSLSAIVEGISYQNAVSYFGLKL